MVVTAYQRSILVLLDKIVLAQQEAALQPGTTAERKEKQAFQENEQGIKRKTLHKQSM